MIQSFGSLIRIGQREVVTWRILEANDTYYDPQELKMVQKYV